MKARIMKVKVYGIYVQPMYPSEFQRSDIQIFSSREERDKKSMEYELMAGMCLARINRFENEIEI